MAGEFVNATIRATDNYLEGDAIEVVIAGDFSTPTDNLDADAGNFTLTVESPGYTGETLGTIVRTIHGTVVARRPDPNELQLDATYDGTTNTTLLVALSETVYSGDTVTALNADAGWITGAAAIVGGAVTNPVGNAHAHQKPIGQWDFYAGVAPYDRVTGTFTVAVTARHRHKVAAVKITAEGLSSGNTVTKLITSQTATQRTTTGLYACAYQADILMTDGDAGGFTQGETIQLDFQVYPVVGDAGAVLNTSDHATATEIKEERVIGWTPITVVCDRDDVLASYAVVSIGGAGGITHTTQAGAESAFTDSSQSFGTIAAALNAGATHVLLAAGDYTWTAPSAVANTWWREIRPISTETADTARIHITTGLTGVGIDRLRVGCGMIAAASGNGFGFYAANKKMMYDGAKFFTNGRTGAHNVSPAWDADGIWFRDCVFEDPAVWQLNWTGGTLNGLVLAFDGCNIGSDVSVDNGTCNCWNRLVACKYDGKNSFAYNFDGMGPVANDAIRDNFVFECNEIKRIAVSNLPALEGATPPDSRTILAGMSMMGNLIECSDGTDPSSLQSIGGQPTLAFINGILLAHNTLVGQRQILGYNNNVTDSDRVRQNWMQHANVFRNWNSKHDVFSGISTATHSWQIIFGLSMAYNHNEGIVSGSFDAEWDGYGFSQGQPGFVNNAEWDGIIGSGETTYGTGLGGGNYAPDPAHAGGSSVLLARVPVSHQHLVADLYGTPFATVADVGAVQVTADASSSVAAVPLITAFAQAGD